MTTGARCVSGGVSGKRQGRGVSRQPPRDPMRPRGAELMGGCCNETSCRRLAKRHHDGGPSSLAATTTNHFRLWTAHALSVLTTCSSTLRAIRSLAYGRENGHFLQQRNILRCRSTNPLRLCSLGICSEGYGDEIQGRDTCISENKHWSPLHMGL